MRAGRRDRRLRSRRALSSTTATRSRTTGWQIHATRRSRSCAGARMATSPCSAPSVARSSAPSRSTRSTSTSARCSATTSRRSANPRRRPGRRRAHRQRPVPLDRAEIGCQYADAGGEPQRAPRRGARERGDLADALGRGGRAVVAAAVVVVRGRALHRAHHARGRLEHDVAVTRGAGDRPQFAVEPGRPRPRVPDGVFTRVGVRSGAVTVHDPTEHQCLDVRCASWHADSVAAPRASTN